MILPLVILYVITLVYLAICERFRIFSSPIVVEWRLLFAVALVRLHAINPAELAFICLETLLFKGILVPGLLFAVIRRTKINRVSRSCSTQSGSLLLSLVATIISLRAKTWQRFSLRQQIDSSSMPRPEEELHVGERGKTLSRLSPMGRIEIDGRIYEAKSLDAYVDPQREVEVVGFENFSVIVKVVK